MAKGQKKGLFPIRSVGLGLVLIAAGWFTTAFNPAYSWALIGVGLVFLLGRPWYWMTRGRHGAKASIARSERKQERSGGVMSRWDHMKNFSATAMRYRWARVLQPTRDDLSGISGIWTILKEPVTRYAAVIGKDNYGKKYVPNNSIVVRLAAARSGKSVALADRILNHEGPAIVTSTRTDQVDMTAELRAMKFGPVYFFNAGGVGNIDSTLKWSVLTGCKDMNTAQRRAADLVGPVKEGSEGARWDSKAIDVLGPLMYVAAHHGLPMRAVAAWIGTGEEERPGVWRDIRELLLDTPDGHFAEEALNQFFKINDRTLTSITSSLLPALAWLTNPNTAALGDSEDAEFDIERDLIDADATLYILGKKERGVGALTGALVAEIVYTGAQIAERRPGGKLDPAMLLALDELPLTVPGPVDKWVLDMGGRGFTFDMVVQQRAGLDAVWGEDGRDIILGNSQALLFGPGCNTRQVAEDFAILSGTRTERRRSYDADGKLVSENEVEVNVVDPGKLVALEMGTAVMFTRGRIAEIRTRRGDTRRDVKRVMSNRRKTNSRVKQAVRSRLDNYEGKAEAEAWAAEQEREMEEYR